MDRRLYSFSRIMTEWTFEKISTFFGDEPYKLQPANSTRKNIEPTGKQYCEVVDTSRTVIIWFKILNHPYCRTWLKSETERGIAWLCDEGGIWQPEASATHLVIGPSWPILQIGSEVIFTGYRKTPVYEKWQHKIEPLIEGKKYEIQDMDSPCCCLFLGNDYGWVRNDEVQLCA